MTSNKFKGVGVALPTPFTGAGMVDYTALRGVLQHVMDGGADYLVVMGTTAESPTMTKKERQEVLDFCIEHNTKKLPIVFGIGQNCTLEVIEDINNYDLSGVDAILSVVPYYNKPTQAGIKAHYQAIAEASPKPIILYNVPGRTGVNMTAETTLELAHAMPEKIIAVKEASGNINQAAYILRERPEGFAVISGDDNLTLSLIAIGCEGVISVSGNVFTKKFCQMVHLALEGKTAQAAQINLQLIEATDMLFAEGNPAGLKAALALKGIVKNNLRLPLLPVSEELMAKLDEQIKKYDL